MQCNALYSESIRNASKQSGRRSLVICDRGLMRAVDTFLFIRDILEQCNNPQIQIPKFQYTSSESDTLW